MAELQGRASLYIRGGRALICPVSTYAVDPDEDGLWRSGGDILIDGDCRLADLTKTELLGAQLRHVLNESPIWQVEQAPTEWDREFDRKLARWFGLSPMRSPYSGMKGCSASRRLDQVGLDPLRRTHGGGFEGFTGVWVKGHEDVHVRWSDTDEALGLALQECIARCL